MWPGKKRINLVITIKPKYCFKLTRTNSPLAHESKPADYIQPTSCFVMSKSINSTTKAEHLFYAINNTAAKLSHSHFK